MDIMQSGRAHGNCGKIADWLIMRRWTVNKE
jgi:hypothetical protein